MADGELELKVAEVLRLYGAGRRDFRSTSIGPDEATFENARLDDADFSFSFVDTSFAGAGLRRAKFVGANLKACVFDRADLSGASFERAAVDAATFARADLEGAVFAGATTHSYTFEAGQMPGEDSDHVSAPGRHRRFRDALQAADPRAALASLARSLRDEGESQSEVLGLFTLFQSDHDSDQNETLYDAILDTMDLIAGWCRPKAAIFPSA
jgi:uncharacterized protein YjbI with pentapeptide repeats